ncbi:hypothetical protein [Tabrizicola soli]|uniref:Uncharacterized protein n=1 Tax=Tabrizicola soli TaxID=2185115 RepID=A0ABV7DXF5_9RHOB|nr:hypothetical protein [Tabrizicola soli]
MKATLPNERYCQYPYALLTPSVAVNLTEGIKRGTCNMIKKPDTSKLLGFKLESGAAVADKIGVKGGGAC